MIGFLLSLTLFSQSDAPALFEKARAFAEVARAGVKRSSRSEYIPLRNNFIKVGQPSNLMLVDLGLPQVSIDRLSGKIVSYNESPSKKGNGHGLTALSDNQLFLVAQKIHRAAGYEGALRLDHIQKSEPADSSLEEQYILQCLPLYKGIPFHPIHHEAFALDPESGRLDWYARPLMPMPPATINPEINKELAESVAFSYVFSQRKALRSIFVYKPVGLYLWKPDAASDEYAVSDKPSQQMAHQQNRALLVYWTLVWDQDSISAKGGNPSKRYDIFVSAQTGRILRFEPAEAGSGGQVKALAISPWSSKTAKYAVSSQRGIWKTAHGGFARVSKPSQLLPGKKVLVKLGNVLVGGTYSAKSNLIWTGEGASQSFAQPTGDLARLLARMSR